MLRVLRLMIEQDDRNALQCTLDGGSEVRGRMLGLGRNVARLCRPTAAVQKA